MHFQDLWLVEKLVCMAIWAQIRFNRFMGVWLVAVSIQLGVTHYLSLWSRSSSVGKAQLCCTTGLGSILGGCSAFQL